MPDDTTSNPLDFLRVGKQEEEEVKKKVEDQELETGTPPPEGRTDKKEKDKKDEKKEDSAKALRQQRDEARKEIERLKKELEEKEDAGELKPLSKVAEYIKSKKGKFDDEAVEEYITKNKERKDELTKAQQAAKDKEDKIRELSIEASEEWMELRKKAGKAEANLIAEVAEIKDGQIRNPQLVEALYKQLTKRREDGGSINAIEAKTILYEFSKEYKKRTGEEYEIPHIKSVVDSVEAFHSIIDESITKKKDWEGHIKKKKLDFEFEQHKRSQQEIEAEIRSRARMRTSLIEEIDEEDFPGFETKEVEGSFVGIFDEMDKILKGEEKPYSAKETMKLFAKGKMFDDLVKKYKELQAASDVERPLSHRSSEKRISSEDRKVDVKTNGHPMDYLKA